MTRFPPRRNPPRGPGPKTARQRILAQWRGLDLAPAEKARADRCRQPSDLMPKVLKELRLSDRRVEAEMVKVWNSSVDPNITAHAQPTGIRKGTLFVSVDSSAWLTEIVRYRRKEILDRLQHSFGREFVTKISFRVG